MGDGDTLTLLDSERRQHKVRLSGIDAPERRQPYGERSKQHLAALAQDKSVMVVWSKHDRYGRIVGRVMLPQCASSECPYTTDLGLEQLKAGLAWHYKHYAKDQPLAERVRYAWIEQQARAKREGLWKQAEPVPPWQFRKPLA